MKRASDRRESQQPCSPPYLTGDGLVLVDRRSHLERRSCWIRALALDGPSQEA